MRGKKGGAGEKPALRAAVSRLEGLPALGLPRKPTLPHGDVLDMWHLNPRAKAVSPLHQPSHTEPGAFEDHHRILILERVGQKFVAGDGALDVVLTSQCCTAISLCEGGFHLGPGRGGVTNDHLCAGRVVPSRATQRRSLTRAAGRTIRVTDWTRGRPRPIRTYPLTRHPARFRFPSMPWWLARSQAVTDLPTGT